jgi:hypothetical protein
MMSSPGIYIFIVLIIIVFFIIALRLSMILAKRAICQVITRFRDFQAVQYQNAMPLEILGLTFRPIFAIHLLKDYKPWALDTLFKIGIIRAGMNGTFYLSEETLSANEGVQSTCRINIKSLK